MTEQEVLRRIEQAVRKRGTTLDLSWNHLSSLPPEIAQLQNLQRLDLSANQLSSLPPEIAQLQNLQRLDLRLNQLSSLPPEFAQLQNLQRLDLRLNQLSSLPPEIAQLQNLQRLDLHLNQLSSLPPEIAQLQNLQWLDLSANQLSSLPPEIGQLQNLQRLYLHLNQLSSLPPEIAQLQNLQELSLSSNQLSSLPPEIGQLQNLQRLDLSSNQLSSLPPEIAQLQNLRELELEGNEKLELPSVILESGNIKIIKSYLEALGRSRFGDNTKIELPAVILESGSTEIINSYVEALIRQNSSNNSFDTEQGTYKYKIQLQEDLRSALKQYLVYFEEFVRRTKGRKITFEVRTIEDGLEITFENIKEDELIIIGKYLNEYMSFIGINNLDELEVEIEGEGNSYDQKMTLVTLRSQVRHFQTLLDMKELELNYVKRIVEKQSSGLLEALIKAQDKPPLQIVGNLENTGVTNFGTISGDVTNSINELKAPYQAELKELLERLQGSIYNDSSLDDEDKEKALDKVNELAKDGKNPTEMGILTRVKDAAKFIKGTALEANELMEVCNEVLPTVIQFFAQFQG